MKYTINWSDIIINELFVITTDTIQDTNLLKLARKIWPDMHYQSQGMKLVDYPGEYELNDYTIEVISDSEWTLNYMIATGEDRIWYVQNCKLVTNRIFADVTNWICDRDDVIVAIGKLDEAGIIHDVR